MAQAYDIAIDLGTSNVVIYMKGRGIVFREPSVVAVDRETQQIIAFGLDAIKNETFSRLEDKKYQNEEERDMLQNLDDVLEDVIDWRMFCKLVDF